MNRTKDFTQVTVKNTDVKYFDVDKNESVSVVLTGKFSTSEVKAYIKAFNKDNVLIVKSYSTDTFNVNTIALTQLREPESVEPESVEPEKVEPELPPKKRR